MGQVIQALRRRQGRRRVEVVCAGGKVLTLAAPVARSLRLGQVLSQVELASLMAQDEIETAYQRAVRGLARRPRSERELRDDMRRAGQSERAQRAVLERLGEAGLVDDAAFAEAWVENRRAFRPRGVAGLRAELRRKGVGTEQIDLALAGYDEMAAAHAALQPVIRRWKIDTWEEFRRRASGHLARRGFTYDTVSRVVRAVWRASRAESEALS